MNPAWRREQAAKYEDEEYRLTWTSLPENLEQKIFDVTGLIQQKANALRAKKKVNWLPYLEAGLITQKDYSFITAFQHAKTKKERDELLDYFKDNAFKTLVNIVQRICIVEEIQKFLVIIDDMLWEDMSRVQRFKPEETEPWKAFLDLLSCSDQFVRNIASRIIAKLISPMGAKPKQPDLDFYLKWLRRELRHDNRYILSVARCLQLILRVDEYRMAFLDTNGIFRITRLLSEGIKPQAQYQLVFCLWMASFNVQVVERMNKYSTIFVLTELLESAPVEMTKLPRIIAATFRNLLEKPREKGVYRHNALLMIQYKVPKHMHILLNRHSTCNDPEFLDDVKVVANILDDYIQLLGTFDEFKLEVMSGRLEWSVVHTSKAFWNENSTRLNENNYEILKILISLLEVSKDSIVLCVAAHDIGQYMSYYPGRGKRIIQELGGKGALLKLLNHSSAAVKYHALKTLQILMLNHYDLLVEYISDVSDLQKVPVNAK